MARRRTPSPGPRRPPSRAARRELVTLHRAIWRRQRQEINASVAGHTRSFRSYEITYQRQVKGYRRILGYEAVLRRLGAADVIYVGDYHTLPQAQKAYLKLVRRALDLDRPVALALEFVLSEHQRHLDAWMRGRLSEASFLKRIGYPGHHVFPVWPGFRPILELARARGIPVVAMDLAGASLRRRDRHAASRIAAHLSARPGDRVMVLAGQLHVAPPHLPARVAAACAAAGLPEPKPLVVYQNAEEIWWQLARIGREHTTEAVDLGRGEVCLINASPVVAQQSYLTHLHGDAADGTLETAPERTFKEMCGVIARFLDLDIGDALERVTVHSLGDLSFLQDLRSREAFTPHELDYMARQILASESYYIPRAKVVYLGTLSVNHAAEEAAHFLRHVVTDDDGDRDGLVDAFYARVLNEALAFFGSKVVNPRRKATHEPALAALVAAWDAGRQDGLHRPEVDAARLALAHLALERGARVPGLRAQLYGESDADLFNAVTHLLGYILGDKLYYGMLRGRPPKAELRELFLDPLDEDGDAFHVYFYLSALVRGVRPPKRP